MTESRRKGVRGELELAAAFRAEGFEARRGQQRRGGPDSPDVIVEGLPWLHPEMKRTERLRLYEALDQARREAGEGQVPVLFHRKSRCRLVAVMAFEDFCKLAREYRE